MTIPKHWKILVTGITSIHGWPIYQRLMRCIPPERLFGIRPPNTQMPGGRQVRAACITDKHQLQSIRHHFDPTHIIHCAGVCDLDVCEERPQWAYDLNVHGTQTMVEVFDDLPLFYMSTDLVFSGENPPENGYTECHPTDPVSVAGQTFAEAEAQLATESHHCIVRLGLPLGDSISGDKGPIDWIESRFKRQLPVTLFHDEFRSCVTCEDIGHMALHILTGQWTGLYHFGGERSWSLYEIGEHVIQRGAYHPALLKGMLRSQEINGPPRIGDVSLNSSRYQTRLKEAI